MQKSHTPANCTNRRLVATRDILPGELILAERPLNRGPKLSTRPVCLGCYKGLDSDSFVPCPDGCGWPVCSTECASLKREHSEECGYFKKMKMTVEVSLEVHH